MKGIISKRIISSFIALTMFVSAFAGIFTFDVAALFAADPVDEFHWDFTELQRHMPLGESIASENVIGRSTSAIIMNTIPFVGMHSAGTTLTGGEGALRILEDDSGSKWCNTATNANNAWFILDAGKPVRAPQYAIRSANDCMSFTSRVLHTWTIQGSNDPAGPWTTLTNSGAQGPGWTANYQLRIFEFNSFPQDEEFRYYRLQILRHGTSANGTALGTSNTTVQFSYFGLLDGYETVGFDGPTEYLFGQIHAGLDSWAGHRPTMRGPNALRLTGNIATVPGGAPIKAKSDTLIKSGLNIQVHPDTIFTYMIAPGSRVAAIDNNNYDYKYHSAHMMVDLKFSDGTRLKDLGARDQYGIGLNPVAQGKGKVLMTRQWNHIESELGKYPGIVGKTITDIIVAFEMPDADSNHVLEAHFDDISIWRAGDSRDLSKIELADFVDIRQGTNSQRNASGSMMPIVATPFPYHMWIPIASTGNRGTDTHNYYEWGRPFFRGFMTSRLASRWMSEEHTLLFTPNSSLTPQDNSATQIGTFIGQAGSWFNHDNEFAVHNYHYGVTFNKDDAQAPGVSAEVTSTEHGAVLRFTFPAGAANRNIFFDVPRGNSDSQNPNNRSAINVNTTSPTFTGWWQHRSDTTANTSGRGSFRRQHFYGQFNATPSYFQQVPHIEGNNTRENTLRSVVSFPELGNGPDGSTVIEMRIATSFISLEQAKKNMGMQMIGLDKDAPVPAADFALTEGKWFDTVKDESKAKWNELLSTVIVEDPGANFWQFRNFYSKMARSHLYPTILHEYTGRGAQGGWQYVTPYRGSNVNPTIMDGYMIYNEGWWDTFKSKWPLLGFLIPEAAGVLTDGIVQHYTDQDGRAVSNGTLMPQAPVNNNGTFIGHSVPRWINPGGNNMMTGTSSDAVIADMYAMYNVDFDIMNGYNAWIKNASVVTPDSAYGGRTGVHEGLFRGYHPWGTSAPAGGGGQLDTTWSLEGYISDAAQVYMLRKMAEDLTEDDIADTGQTLEYWQKRLMEEAIYYENRAKGFVHLFDSRPVPNVTSRNTVVSFSSGWFNNRFRDGSWRAFNPLHWGNGYTEDNAWPYRFLAPQDGRGLANLLGEAQGLPGPQALGESLDEGFYAEGPAMDIIGGGYGTPGWIHETYEKREVKMGQFGLSNQPAYHMPWMYLHSDRPWQTQFWTRASLARAYSGGSIGYGYLGEEDNGAMASWYVWAAMGLYPLDLASGTLVIGSPEFQKTTITDDRGKIITINAINNNYDNVYIQSITVNGQPYTKPYLSAELLSDDLNIVYVMGPEPNKTLFTEGPPSLTAGDNTPDILVDLTYEGIQIVLGGVEELADAEVPTVAVTNISLTGNNRADFLFDDMSANTPNNSGTGQNKNTADANFTERTATITYFDPLAPMLEMYTLTSSATAVSAATGVADRYPTAWTMSGSNDGDEWIVLDERSGEVFEWIRYTRPFVIDKAKQGNYKYYKLDITATAGTGNLRLAQIEFMANQFARSNFIALKAAIDEAEEILDGGIMYAPITVEALEAVLVDARAMLEKGEAATREIGLMITRIRNAVSSLIRVKHVTELNVATEFDESSGPGREETGGIPNTNGGAPNAWIAYRHVNFDDETLLYNTVTLNYAADSRSCNAGSSVEVRIGAPNGQLIAVFDRNSPVTGGVANPTGNWQTAANWTDYREITVPVLSQVVGIHDVYLVLRTGPGTPNEWVANIRNFRFGGPVEYIADKAELDAAIADALELDEDRYSAASWAAFAEALDNAILVSKEEFVTQYVIDNALMALQEAREALRELFTVTFDYNDGSEAVNEVVVQGDTVVRPPDPTMEGYTFEGWTLNGDEFDFDTAIAQDITLVAEWKLIPVTSQNQCDYYRNRSTRLEV